MNFKLRPWTLEDLDSLVRNANNHRIAQNMTDQFPYPYSKEKGTDFIRQAMKSSPTTIFAIEVNGEAAGGIGLHLQQDVLRKNIELGYWLAQPYWNQGIVTQAIRQMVEYGFSTFDVNRIYARPFGFNLASQRALEKAGFKLEARLENTIYKNGSFTDELIYAVRKT